MKYAKELLEKERVLISNALVGFNKKEYPEAFKRQQKKLQSLDEALIKLNTCKEN